jgi:D-amino-acid oxidase
MVTDARVLPWSDKTRVVLEEIAGDPTAGVRLVSGIEATRHSLHPPMWAPLVHDFQPWHTDGLPSHYVGAWRYTIPLVDMPRYLGYLTRRLAEAGGRVELAEVTSFADVARRADAVVNCSGLGSRTLVPDPELYPIRGQLVVVDNPGIDTFFQDDSEGDDITYFLPHGDHVVLGGSATSKSSDLAPNKDVAAGIVGRCAEVEPLFATATVREHRVGLRPTRSAVRLERTTVDGIPLVHNYGHGGSGVTLSWGCAEEVLALLAAADG